MSIQNVYRCVTVVLSCTVWLKKSYCIVYLFPEGYDCAFSDCLTESLPLLPERMVSMRFGAVEQRCIAESNKYMAIDRPWHHRSLVCLCPLASSNRCGVDMCERLPCIGMVRSLRWSKGRYICKYITYTCTCTHTFFKGSYTLWSDVWKVFCAWALICNYMWYMYISVV